MKKPGDDWGSVAALYRRIAAACDAVALGEIYFHWGGERFWAERAPSIAELGERLARALLPKVKAGGVSLWVGAGVAELPVLLAEVMLRGRDVVATNLRLREVEVLNEALDKVAPDLPLRYVAGDATEVAAGRTFDHLGCISVFTDPETWPLLSDVAYGRIAPVQIDVERFVAEREVARTLAAKLFGRLARPGLVTTSAEEVSWFLECAAAAGLDYEADEELVETAVVGDPVGFVYFAAPPRTPC